MKIYTSYFANVNKIPEHITPVSIARYTPRWFKGLSFEDLAPPPKLLGKAKEGKISNEEYTVQYIEYLEDNFSQGSLIKKLELLYGCKDIVLLCFEKSGEFCHRRVLAGWLKYGLDIDVEEF